MSEVFWVAGSASDCGKTTLAATLLRVLAKKGRSTIAFKPHAAVNFFKSIDSLIQQGSGHVAGGDAAAFAPLCTAIPDDVSTSDVSSVLSCNRSWFYFSIREIFFHRTGSRVLGNERVFRVKHSQQVLRYPDVRDVLERMGYWDLLEAGAPIEHNVRQCHESFGEETQAAWEWMTGFPWDTAVVEGASFYLPVWPGYARPDYLLVTHNGWVDIHTDLHDELKTLDRYEFAPMLTDLAKLGRSISRRSHRMRMPILPSDERAEVIETVVEELLHSVGVQ